MQSEKYGFSWACKISQFIIFDPLLGSINKGLKEDHTGLVLGDNQQGEAWKQ